MTKKFEMINLVLIFVFLIFVWKSSSLFLHLYKTSRLPRPVSLIFLKDLLCNEEELFIKVWNWSKNFPIWAVIIFHKSCIFLSDPKDVETLLCSMKHSQKSDMYLAIRRWLQHSLLMSTGTKWQQRRKLLTPAFHFKMLEKYLDVFQRETSNIIKILINQDQPVDVIPILAEFTLKTINEIAMGDKLDFNNKIHLQYQNNIRTVCSLALKRIARPWLHNDFIYYHLLANGRKEKVAIKEIHDYIQSVIDKKTDSSRLLNNESNEKHENISYAKRKQLALMDLLIEAQKDNIIDLEGIHEELNTFIFGGHDTVSLAISYMLMELANNEHFQDLILQEINEVLGESTDFSVKYLNELKFLEMCIKENLRLHPSVPIISRLTEEDFVTTAGYLIPRKSIVNINIFAMHRNSDIYPDPEKFDPYRFLPENVQKRHPFAFIPFSAGPRNCIGQKLAMLEMKIFFIGILRNFILKPVDNNNTLIYITDFTLRTKNGVKVKFVKRKS